MLRLRADELVDRLAVAPVDPFEGETLVAVECDGSTDDAVAAAVEAALAGVPTVVVAHGATGGDPLAGAVDVVAAGDGELDAVAVAVDSHPDAAVALAVLLRGGASRSIPEGLAAESAAYSLLQAGPDHRRWLAERPHRAARPPAAGEPVRVERAGRVLRIVLDRPGVHNAYSATMRDALIDALAVASLDRSLHVELQGEGPSFCSGGDLGEFGTGPDPAAAHLLRLRRSAPRAVADVAARLTVRVHGAAIGAGTELAAFAGRVVASPDARFSLPELSMGLVPGAGGTVSVPRRIGRQRTAWLVLTGTTIDAPTAAAWGLADELRDGGRGGW